MNIIYQLTSIDAIFFEVLGYPMSYVELIGTLSGLASVWLATRANIFTFHTGILNTIAFFVIFFQVQLYADMFLQVFFLGACIYGWITWANRTEGNVQEISMLRGEDLLIWLVAMSFMIFALGRFNANIQNFFPDIFEKPAAYPYWDAFTTSASIVAMILMVQRKVESWVFWIVVDIVAVVLYYLKGIKFISLEYLIFLVIAINGLIGWWRYYRENSPDYTTQNTDDVVKT